jgi:hypothetical protein
VVVPGCNGFCLHASQFLGLVTDVPVNGGELLALVTAIFYRSL